MANTLTKLFKDAGIESMESDEARIDREVRQTMAKLTTILGRCDTTGEGYRDGEFYTTK